MSIELIPARMQKGGSPGTVYLVGAGPGDPELLTLRAARLLRRADIVIHDALVGEAILAAFGPHSVRIDVGKRCGGRHTPQAEINRLLVDSARRYRTVVRLKGGDPFVFGRGGEEALALRAEGIACQIVPGITAASGISAYAGIPLTHRRLAASVTFVTGHEVGGREESRIDWDALAKLKGTLAIYMGVGGLEGIANRLVAAGRSPGTPAAIVEWGTHARQRTITGALDDIAARAREAAVAMPALVLVGEVAALHEELAWFDRLPLHGVRILIGRSRPQPSRIARALARLGAEVQEYPHLVDAAADDDAAIDTSFRMLSSYRWLLFTSPAAVKYFRAAAEVRGLDARALADIRIAACGWATGQALRKQGIIPEVTTRTFRIEAVLARLEEFGSLAGERILFPREVHLASPLAAGIRRAGARVDELEIFRTLVHEGRREELAFVPRVYDVLVLPSSSAARSVGMLPAVERMVSGTTIAIGPQTAHAARESGLEVDLTLGRHSLEAVVQAVVESVESRHVQVHAEPPLEPVRIAI